jgi:putative DNA primase/helicase
MLIVQRLNSYTEISPSGTGLRIFLEAKLPPQDRKIGKIECYETGRYLTVTGNRLQGTPTTIELRQREMEEVHTEVFGERQLRRNKPGAPRLAQPVTLEDDELLARAFASKNGDAVRSLFLDRR